MTSDASDSNVRSRRAGLLRCLSLIVPLPLVAVPSLLLHRPEWHTTGPWRNVATIIIAPGMYCLFLHPTAGLVLAGVFWYLLGVLALAAITGRRDGFLRTLLAIVVVLAFLVLAGLWSLRGWNVD
jgi:hypothetical protein